MTPKTNLPAALIVSGLFAATASGQTTYYSDGNNQAVDNVDTWYDTRDNSGNRPTAMPTSPDGDTWVIQDGDRLTTGNGEGDDGIFSGSTLVIEINGTNDSELLMNGGDNTGTGAFVVQDVVLDGGALNTFRSSNRRLEAGDVSVTANTGAIGAEDDPARYFFDTITGSDEIRIQSRGNGAPTITRVNDGRVVFESGIDYSGFTGTFRVQSDTSTGGSGFFTISENIATASFALRIDVGGTFSLGNDISVTTLQLGPDFVPAGGGTGPGGAYQYSDFTASQQAYFEDQGGTLTVTTNGTVTIPTVTQEPAESIDETVATIIGEVTDAGGETPTLTIYYGTTDGGTVPGDWDTSVPLGLTFGEFAQQLTGLTNNTTYFYRCRVTNSAVSSDSEGWAPSSDSFTTGTVPALVVSGQNGNITDSTTWTGSPPVPTSGTSDMKTWQILHQVDRGGDPTVFAGETLIVGDGISDDGSLRLEPGDGSLTVRDLVLNTNGTLFQDNNNNTLFGDTITLNGGLISAARIGGNERMFLNFENYAGSGTVYIFGNNANGNPGLVFQTSNATPGTAMQGFTGTLHHDRLNGAGGAIAFDFDITVATFGIVLADTDSDLPPGTNNGGASDDPTFNGRLRLNDGIDIMITDLHLYDEASDGSVLIDVHLPDGTYTLDTVTNPGATDLTNVGGQDYSRFFTGGTGTVTVDSGVGGGNDFSDWIAGFPGVGGETGFGDDPDKDGIESGLENFFGTDPSAANAGLAPGVFNTNGSTTVTFTHPENPNPADDVSAPAYRWSLDLDTFHGDGDTASGTTVDFGRQTDTPGAGTTTVTATITGTVPDKLFVNVSVTQQ